MVVPNRWVVLIGATNSGSAVDACLDAAARALRAERAADGDVLHAQCALYLSPSLPPMSAQQVGPLLPLSHP